MNFSSGSHSKDSQETSELVTEGDGNEEGNSNQHDNDLKVNLPSIESTQHQSPVRQSTQEGVIMTRRRSSVHGRISLKDDGVSDEKNLAKSSRKRQRKSRGNESDVEENSDPSSNGNTRTQNITKGMKSSKPSSSRPFNCVLCDARFLSRMQLKTHMCTEHGLTKDESDVEIGKVYGGQIGRSKHKFNKVPDKLFYPDNEDKTETSGCSSKEMPNKPKCPTCGKVFDHITKAQIHFDQECSKKPLHCGICGNDFNHVHRYALHMQIHKNKSNGVEYKCETCGKNMYHQKNLKEHQAIHTREFMCDICGKGFAHKRVLHRHRNKHTKEKPFTCTLCPKVYYDEISLKRHVKGHQDVIQITCHVCGEAVNETSMKTHMTNRHSESDKVECPICKKVLKRKSYLAGHIKEVHQGAGKFPCTWPDCDKSFNRKRCLVAHLNMHNNVRRFVCQICSKKFRNKNHLFNHTNWHNGVRPHQCQMCEKSFLTKGNLTKHLVTHKKKGAVVSSKVKQELPQESPNVGSQNESYVHVQFY